MTAPQAAPVIAGHGLRKRFGGVAALDDFSISVGMQQVQCVVGPNGAGKSTLFKVMAGILRPDAGSLSILGVDVVGMKPRQIARLGVATKLQIPRVFPSLTVGEHLEIAARVDEGVPRLLGLRRSRADAGSLVRHLLEEHGLDPVRDRAAQELSHGERQWLEIVMMLATRPRVLLLDEPGAGMTVGDKGRMATLLRGLSRSITIVVIEHDLEFVQLVADKVVVMHRGRLLTEGSFDQISRDPQVGLIYLGSAAQ